MGKKKKQFIDLTWNELEEWAGGPVLKRGRNYQRQGLVSDLTKTNDGALIAWVNGSRGYATQVKMDDDGHPDSICTCPYEFNCKHGVAVILEYLDRLEKNEDVPEIPENDERLELLRDEDWDDDEDERPSVSMDVEKDLESFLKSKTKAQLIKLILELANNDNKITQNLTEQRLLSMGNRDAIMTRLRHEIRHVTSEPGWQDHWRDEGHTPDYSGIRSKFESLLNAGEADELLAVGKELLDKGIQQAEESHDEGETAMEVSDCMPLIVKALESSSLEHTDKLAWAVDAVLKDPFDLCEAFAEYLYEEHPETAWNILADRLTARLNAMKDGKDTDDFSRNYDRDRLSNWIIHALESANRTEEIVPLCIAEAKKTGSYDRLVAVLMEAKRFNDAMQWIQEGIKATKKKLPGIASSLRNKLQDIQEQQKNWPVVAAIETEKFVDRPSRQTFISCKKAASKAKMWPKVRQYLLAYLEKGVLPWKQKGWPLPASGLDEQESGRHQKYPMINVLIEIAIDEKNPEEVLKWYDRQPKSSFGWYSASEDEIARAIQSYAPDRAVKIWKKMAEQLIAQVKPKAYQSAITFLKKAAKIMAAEKKELQWAQYIEKLKEEHIRKRRLIELMDGIDDKPIVKGRH